VFGHLVRRLGGLSSGNQVCVTNSTLAFFIVFEQSQESTFRRCFPSYHTHFWTCTFSLVYLRSECQSFVFLIFPFLCLKLCLMLFTSCKYLAMLTNFGCKHFAELLSLLLLEFLLSCLFGTLSLLQVSINKLLKLFLLQHFRCASGLATFLLMVLATLPVQPFVNLIVC
jgi:hypothetical protein